MKIQGLFSALKWMDRAFVVGGVSGGLFFYSQEGLSTTSLLLFGSAAVSSLLLIINPQKRLIQKLEKIKENKERLNQKNVSEYLEEDAPLVNLDIGGVAPIQEKKQELRLIDPREFQWKPLHYGIRPITVHTPKRRVSVAVS